MSKMVKLLLSFFLFYNSSLLAQEKSPISVHVEIIGKGDLYEEIRNDSNYYFARFEITNNEDSTLPITVWNCSWNFNWKPDTDSIRVFSGRGCDANYPESILLPSKKSLVFYGAIYFKNSNKKRNFKVGFANCSKEFKNYGLTFFNDPRNPEGKVYWSNEIFLIDHYYFEKFLK